MCQFIPSLFECPHYSLRIICPSGFFIRNQFIKTRLNDSKLFKVQGEET